MKVDRRSFLGLGLGAAAGIAVSPATWKLMDDSSIWTQNWPWTPVPRDGEVTYDNSVCSLCPGNCGISVRKIAGRPVKIEGREGYPVNDGGVCLHGISGLQYLFDPSRIETPLKKSAKGFEKISWDEAIEMVAAKLNEIRGSGNAARIACITGKDKGTIPGLFKRLLTAMGSTSFFAMETMDQTWAMTLKTIHGVDASPGFDLANADYILSFGCGFIEGWGSPVHNFRINAARKDRGAKLVQVEPRLSNTAAAADSWVPAKPGTEADLALGLCNVLISENLYDNDYVLSAGSGFEQFVALVKSEYTTDKVAQTTGIPESAIIEIAKAFSKASHPIAIAGRGRGDSAGSLREFAAVHALNCLAGNINKEGGVWTLENTAFGSWPEMAGSDANGIEGVTTVSQLMTALSSGAASPVEALLVYEANPCYAMHDVKTVQKAMEKIPFIVSFSSYMDETSHMAHVILPSHIYLERYEDLPGGAGMAVPAIGLSRPVAGPVFDTRHPGDSVIGIAKAMDEPVSAGFPWETYEACIEAVAGDSWAAMTEDGYVLTAENPPDSKPAIDFAFLAGNSGAVMADGSEDSFPFVLVPVNNMRLVGSSLASSPFAVKTVADTVLKNNDGFVEINPETAHKLGVSQGDMVTVSTPKGSAKVRANLFDGIMPGVIAMAKGLGHAAGENRYVGGKGVNINDLMSPVNDAASGLDAAWGIRAQISRA
ncbi:MAG: menaquinone reductase molybdopterin-binding-like subunit QrcB [Pseudomonadota bacterium]